MGGVSLAWASTLYLNIKCRLLRGFCYFRDFCETMKSEKIGTIRWCVTTFLAVFLNKLRKKKRKMPLVQDEIVYLRLKGGKLPLLMALF